MILNRGNTWILGTPETTYLFRITETGHAEHLYYGPAIRGAEDLTENDIAAIAQKRAFPSGNLISYDEEHLTTTLEDMALEMSSTGKGDVREPFVELIMPDGSRTSDFLYDRAIESSGKPPFETLPGSYAAVRHSLNNAAQAAAETSDRAPDAAAATVDHLALILRDKNYDLELELHYYVYEDCDVICRASRLVNGGDRPVQIERLMSAQLDLPRADLAMTTFRGAWAREMTKHTTAVNGPRVVNASAAGASSNRANPFVMLHPAATTEGAGLCYAANLIYSGNHYEAAEVNAYGMTRFLSGINPQGFMWTLEPGEAFEAPEAVLTCSKNGFSGISRHMHAFIRTHIVRGEWADRIRPILLNSWEAAYFKISEDKLLKLAKAGKEAGAELFVMDDGWFGKRDDDTKSLGDWTANTKKLPGGLGGLSKKIHDMGLMFGIWVEPEMVNVDSDLYRAHPEWVMQIPDGTRSGGDQPGTSSWRPHSEGRHQRILDLANPAVVDHLIKEIGRVIEEAKADYVKWDMNRIFSDAYSPYLAGLTGDSAGAAAVADGNCAVSGSGTAGQLSRQGETAHRYILGLYRLMQALTEKFPKVLFEGCASGGNRFDLGILSYFPQIWASDNTDAICRAYIQEGYSYGYPMSVVASHFSSVPNHQTLRVTPIATRFAVAAFGVFGLECNLADMPKAERDKVAGLIGIYKVWRDVLQTGDFYRIEDSGYQRVNGDGADPVVIDGFSRIHQWTCVSKDKTRAVGLVLQELVTPNSPYLVYRPSGLDPDKTYRFYNRVEKQDIRRFGDLVNTVAPIHVKQDSFLHKTIARFYQMPGEQEDIVVRGSVLMEAGITLSPAFAGTGYSDEVRHFQDFSARLYFMEACQ